MKSARWFVFSALLLIYVPLLAAPADAPIISVNGQVATTSPVTRGTSASLSMTTSFANGSIFYTLDGIEPSAVSTRYTEPFRITKTKSIRAIACSLDFSQNALATSRWIASESSARRRTPSVPVKPLEQPCSF